MALAGASAFLVAVRSVCRVCVAASDEVRAEHLDAPARILGFGRGAEGDPAGALLRDLERHLAASERAVTSLLPGLS